MEEKLEELKARIAKWQEELDTVWAGKETDAAEVERRNLRNLIANAKREIEEIENPKTQNELGNNFDDLKKKFEEIKKEGQDKAVEKNRLRHHIERLTEERENYASQKNTAYKDIYNEYTKQIEDAEKEIEELEKEEPQAEQDKKIRTVTALRQEYETQIRDKEKEIRVVKRQIEDIEYATEEAMVEKELEDGTKVKTPKVLELYKDLEKLEKELKDLENKKDECQQYLDEIKGKVESRELDPEEIKYFHGQGDVVENTRDDRRANDEYFGFEKVKPGMRKEPRGVDDVTPKPGPDPEPVPKPNPENDDPNKYPMISFSEVLAKTQTQHISTLRYQIYKMAKAPLFKNGRDADTLQKVLSFLPNVVSSPFKIIAKGVNAVLGTDEKIEEMKENIADLTPDEFAVLTQSPERANEEAGKKIKDNFDTEYLNSRVMRERKINTAYLDIVGDVLEEKKGLTQIENDRQETEKRLKAIRKLRKKEKDPVEIAKLDEQIIQGEELLQKINEKGNELSFEVDAYRDGVKHKTGEYKDIKGWIFAKRNPDNRNLNQELATVAKERREAAARGEEATVANLTAKMRDLEDENTNVKTVGFNINNKIDIGKNSRGGIKVLNQTRQNKGRLLLANAAIVTTFVRALTDLHNTIEATRVNEANSNIEASIKPYEQLKQQISKATDQEAAKEMGFAGGAREVNSVYNGKYGQDISDHLHEAGMVHQDGLHIEETTPYLQQIIQKAVKDNTYANHGDAWVHDGMAKAIEQLGDGNAFKELINALKEPIKTNVSGEMVDYAIEPATYATLLATILSQNNLSKREKRQLKKELKEASKIAKEQETEKSTDKNDTSKSEEVVVDNQNNEHNKDEGEDR